MPSCIRSASREGSNGLTAVSWKTLNKYTIDRDIDLVTFFYIPDGYNGPTLLQRYPGLFNPEFVKYHYAMDAYFVELNQIRIEESIEQALYWYSLWSHTRTERWKGYVQVDLTPDHDAAARAKLEADAQ